MGQEKLLAAIMIQVIETENIVARYSVAITRL